jgi:hypothetical protein
MSKESDLVKELHAHRNDPEEWSEETEDIEVRPSGSEVVSFRLPSEELDALAEASKEAGESLSEYVRKAIAVRLHGIAIGPVVQVSLGTGTLLVRSHIVTGTRSENVADAIPDLPPLTVAVR